MYSKASSECEDPLIKKKSKEFRAKGKPSVVYDKAIEIFNEHPIHACIIILATSSAGGAHFSSDKNTVRDLEATVNKCAPLFEKLRNENLQKADFGRIGVAVKEIYEVLSHMECIGYTGASKIMHLFNRSLFVIWDDCIREKYHCGNTADDYLEFLKKMQKKSKYIKWDGPGKAFARAIDEYDQKTVVSPRVKEERLGNLLESFGPKPNLHSLPKANGSNGNGYHISPCVNKERTRDAASQTFLTGSFFTSAMPMAAEMATPAEGRETGNGPPKMDRGCDFETLVGESKPMQEMYRQIEQLANKPTSVLLLGESGVGKEIVARAIHYHKESPRRTNPFIALDCNTLPESLFESELFGHEKGAFTGATKKIGRCELADKGTLFLDEIGEIPPTAQVKLLRFLQEHEFMRVGGTQSIRVDVRIIAATNHDIEKAVKEGKFREDLYYRINVVPIRIPPLRERSEDIPLLIGHFVKCFSAQLNIAPKTFTRGAIDLLTTCTWPGNVRELQNVVERLLVLSNKDVITEEDLPESVRFSKLDIGQYSQKVFSDGFSLEQAERQFLTEIISEALRRSNGVHVRAAELLKTSRRSLRYQMDKLGLT